MATQVPFNNTVPTQDSNRLPPCPGLLIAPDAHSAIPPIPLQRLTRTRSHQPPLQWSGRPAVAAGDWGTGAIVNHTGGSVETGTGLDNAVPFGANTAINQPASGAAPGPSGDRSAGTVFTTIFGGVLG